ncbi:MAG: ABC transporter substrate-binding protein [Pseudomonadota bacterium]
MTIKTVLKTAVAAIALAAVALPVSQAVAQTPDNMLVIANRIDDITTLDPAQSFEFAGSDIIRNVYGGLVNFDPSNLAAGYQPDIAESWEVSEDGRTITFKIREGLTFTSGNPVRAEDAAFSLQRVVKLNKTPSFILTQFGFTPENVEEVITFDADAGTVSITTDKQYATSFVLNCLTATVGSIVDKETVMANEVDGDLGNQWMQTNTAGSYAYKDVVWKPNESVTMVANPDFVGGEPAMKRVIVRHVVESATQRLLLERGDIDIARNLNPEDVAGLSGNDDVKVLEELRGRIMYIALNQKHPELSKPAVRQAFKLLVDYAGMEQSFLKGQWRTHQNFLPATYLGASTENPFSFNIEQAKNLLEEAGVTDLEVEVGVREAQERIEIAQSFQNAASQVGVKINITVATAAQTLTRYRARELDVYLGAWGPDYPDPHTNAATFAFNPDNSDAAGATGILAWRNSWDIPELTALTAAAVEETDTAERITMYEEIQGKFRDTSPFVIMFQKIEQNGARANVEGFSMGEAITAAAYWNVTK